MTGTPSTVSAATPPASVPPAPAPSAPDLFQQVKTTLVTDAINNFYPVLQNLFTQVAQNGSVSNEVAQGVAVLPDLEKQVPDFEQQASQDLAKLIGADLQNLVNSIKASNTPTSAAG
jgi:hypothetical protein